MSAALYKPLPVQAAKPTQSQQAQNDGVAAGNSISSALQEAQPSQREPGKRLGEAGANPAALETLCAYCGKPAEGNYAVHRDGFCKGPEVDLCDACGSGPYPTLLDIWARISTTPREII